MTREELLKSIAKYNFEGFVDDILENDDNSFKTIREAELFATELYRLGEEFNCKHNFYIVKPIDGSNCYVTTENEDEEDYPIVMRIESE